MFPTKGPAKLDAVIVPLADTFTKLAVALGCMVQVVPFQIQVLLLLDIIPKSVGASAFDDKSLYTAVSPVYD